jgi:hypothetical protein
MPRYVVHLCGSGIDIPGDDFGDSSARIRGFYVNRVVAADSDESAGATAINQVRTEWASGRFARFGTDPSLSIESARKLGLWDALWARDGGYSFHQEA